MAFDISPTDHSWHDSSCAYIFLISQFIRHVYEDIALILAILRLQKYFYNHWRDYVDFQEQSAAGRIV